MLEINTKCSERLACESRIKKFQDPKFKSLNVSHLPIQIPINIIFGHKLFIRQPIFKMCAAHFTTNEYRTKY